MAALFTQENAYHKPENSGCPEIPEEGFQGTLKGFNFSNLDIILNMMFQNYIKKLLLEIPQE